MLNGHPDICNVLDHNTDEQKAKLELFGFPTECPVPAGKKCTDGSKKHDISKYKSLLPLTVGVVTTHYDVIHDTVNITFFIPSFYKSRSMNLLFFYIKFQGKTCVVASFEITT